MNWGRIQSEFEAVLLVGALLLGIITYQFHGYVAQCERDAEHAELLYLRVWKHAHLDSITVEKTQDECMQEAFKMLRPFLMSPLGDADPQFPITPPSENMRTKTNRGIV